MARSRDTREELDFCADLALTLLSGAVENAARGSPSAEWFANIVAQLDALDRRIERVLRRLREVDDATMRRTDLRRLVRYARRLLQLAARIAVVGRRSEDAAHLGELITDARRAVTRYVRACAAELVPARRDV